MGFTSNKEKKYPVRHIGIMVSLCNKKYKANLRTDLGYNRYLSLGIHERFINEKPYRICSKCLKVIKQNENKYNTL